MSEKVCVIGLVIISVFMVFKSEQVFGGSTLGVPCIYAWGEGLEYVNSGNQSCDDHILLFSVENDKISSDLEADTFFNFNMLDRYFMLLTPCFSNEELREIRDSNLFNNLFIKYGGYELVNLQMPAYSSWFGNGREVMDLLFTPVEDHIILENPKTGEDMYLSGIDYVKFRGAPLIPVPNPAD